MRHCKRNLVVPQDREEQEIFKLLCDLAVLEEARERLGDEETRRLLGSRDVRNWMNPYRSKRRLPHEKRDVLLEALARKMKPEEQTRAAVVAEVAERLSRYVVHDAAIASNQGRPPRAAPRTR